MNTENGSLGFEYYLDNTRLTKTVEEANRKVQGFTDTAVKGGEAIDDAFKVTAENIKIQKNVIGQLEKQVANLKMEITKLPDGSQSQIALKKEAEQVGAELAAEKLALKQLEEEVGKTETAIVSYRTQLRQLRDEMIAMEAAGQRNSDAYRELQGRAGELKDAIGDAQAQMSVMADDERMFKGIVSTIGGLTGGFSAAQGAVGLFAGESENLNRIMLKVQSLMAITIGLQQVAEMLNKDSYFSVVVLTKAKEMMAVAEMKVATAMGVSTAAARVLMATMTLGLSIAITGVIILISKLQSKAAESRKQMEEFNKSVADSAMKPLAAFEDLAVGWSRLGDSLKSKEAFIKENADKFKELGVNITGVNDAERILVERKQDFVDALIFRAKAMASAEMASSKYKEALEKQLELENTPQELTMKYYEGGMMKETSVRNSKYTDLKAEQKALEDEGKKLFELSYTNKDEENKRLKELGLGSNEIVEGSIAALEQLISQKKELYKNATTDGERSKLLKEIKEQESILEKMDVMNKKDNNKELKDKANKKLIDDFEKSLQDEIKMADSILDVLAIIEDKKKKLTGDGSEVDNGKKEALDNAYKDARLRQKDETNKLVSDYAGFLYNKIQLQKQYNDDMLLLDKELSAATTEEEKAKVKSAMSNRTTQFNKDMKSSGDSNYDSLLKEYQTFEQKKQSIIDKFEEDRATARLHGNEEVIKEIDKSEKKAIADLTHRELGEWKTLFASLDGLRKKELKERLAMIDAQLEKEQEGSEAYIELLKQRALVDSEIKGSTSNTFKDIAEAGQLMSQVGDDISKSIGETVTSLASLGSTLSNPDASGFQKASGIVSMALAAGAQIQQAFIDYENKGINAQMALNEKLAYQLQVESTINDLRRERTEIDMNSSAFLDPNFADKFSLSLDKMKDAEGEMNSNLSTLMENAVFSAKGSGKRRLFGKKTGTYSFSMSDVIGDVAPEVSGSNSVLPYMFGNGWVNELFHGGSLADIGKAFLDPIGIFGGHADSKAKKDAFGNLGEAFKETLNSMGKTSADIASMSSEEWVDFYSMMEKGGYVTDEGTKKMIANAKEAAEEYAAAMEEMKTIISDVAGSLGDSLSDSLVTAFQNGTDAASAFKDSVNEVLNSIFMSQLQSTLFQSYFDKLQAEMQSSMDGGDGEWGDDIQRFFTDIEPAIGTAQSAMEAYNKAMQEAGYKGFESADSATTNGLTGAIKGMSEETATLLSGYINAVRINQITHIDLTRQQLFHLAEIAANTRYTRYLEGIDKKLGALSSDSLRAQGLS